MVLNCFNIIAKSKKLEFDIDLCKTSFHCPWDDPVRESFNRFLKKLDEYKNKIHSSISKINTECVEISFIKDHVKFDLEINAQKMKVGAIII